MRSSLALAVAVAAAAALALAGCGGSGPKLHNLRCRTDSCQHPEDPLRVLLAVDFDDPSGTLASGSLELRVDGRTQIAVALRDIFNLQGLAADARTGTLQIDDDVLLSSIKDGTQFKLSLLATNGQGHDSNEPSMSITVHLGSGAP
jgi:hypothetical protein